MTGLPPSVANAWHLVALSQQVRPGNRLGITVTGRSVVLFRGEQGLGALVDRCPHRNYPLSLGRVEGAALECPYHGWRFDPSGQCVAVPGCDLPAAIGKLAATPVRVAERHGGIFV